MHAKLMDRVLKGLQRNSVFVSLLFIAINPLSENNSDGESSVVRTKRTRFEESAQQNHEVKPVLLQGTFPMSTQFKNKYNQANAMNFSSDDYQYDVMRKGLMTEQMEELIALYMQRVEVLLEDRAMLQEAKQELAKVFMIDPNNFWAKSVEMRIRKLEEAGCKEKGFVEDSSVVSEELILRTSDDLQVENKKGSVKINEVDTVFADSDSEVFKSDGVIENIEEGFLADSFELKKEEALKNAQKLILENERDPLNTDDAEVVKLYAEAKEYLSDKDYLRTIKLCKKLLEINSNHFYAKYARRFIAFSQQKMVELEDAAFSEIVDFKQVDAKKSVQIKENVPGDLCSVKTGEVVVLEGFENDRQILKMKINADKYIAEKKFDKALASVISIIQLDPKSRVAEEILAEINLCKIRAIKKKSCFSKQQHLIIKNEIEQKHKEWNALGVQTRLSVFDRKYNELINLARVSLKNNDFFEARRALDSAFVLQGNSKEVVRLESLLEDEISKLQTLIVQKQVAVKDEQESVSKEIKQDDVKRICKILTENGVEVPQTEEPISSGQTLGLFAGISEYKPFTVLSSDKNKINLFAGNSNHEKRSVLKGIESFEENDVKEQSVHSSSKSKEFVLDEESDLKEERQVAEQTTACDAASSLEYKSKRLDVLKRIRENFMRGQKHYLQKNYSLALVSFNKVEELDSQVKMFPEISVLIREIKKKLDNR